MDLFSFLIGVILFATAQAAIGPVADVHIVNKAISPDGFTRSCVDISVPILRMHHLKLSNSTVLAGGTADSATFPGPVITGSKVR